MDWYFEDFTVGQKFKTRMRVLTPTEMDLIPVIIGATNPLFLSDAAAQKIGRPKRQASSLIPVALALGQTYQTGIFDQTGQLLEIHGKILGRCYEQDALVTEVEIMGKMDRPEDKNIGVVTYRANVSKPDGTKVAQVDFHITVKKKTVP